MRRLDEVELVGEGFIAFVPRHGAESELEAGITPMAGPLLVGAVDYDSEHTDQYFEIFVAEPARVHQYVGLSFTTMAVSTPRAKGLGQALWGFPREQAELSLSRHGRDYSFRWKDRRIRFVGRRVSPAVAPVPYLPAYALQIKNGHPVAVPSRRRARTGLAYAEISVPDGDPLSHLSGRYPAVYMTGKERLLEAREA